jgi:hypothetical protein
MRGTQQLGGSAVLHPEMLLGRGAPAATTTRRTSAAVACRTGAGSCQWASSGGPWQHDRDRWLGAVGRTLASWRGREWRRQALKSGAGEVRGGLGKRCTGD